MMKRALCLGLMGAALFSLPALNAGDGDSSNAEVRRAIVKWVTDNNLQGAQARWLPELTKQIDTDLQAGTNVSLAFGARTVKGGKAALLHTWAGKVYLFRLSEARAQARNLKPGDITYSQGAKRSDRPAPRLLAELVRPLVDNATKLDATKQFTGDVFVRNPGKMPDKVAVRISYSVNGHTTSKFMYPPQVPTKSGRLRFSFDPMVDLAKGDKPVAGPVVVFIDLCLVKASDKGVEVTLLSNSVAKLVDVVTEGNAGGPRAMPIE
jgi:hypothetical protein